MNEHGDMYPVILVNAGESYVIANPKVTFNRCAAIWKRRGLNHHLCHHCVALVDACQDAALLREILERISPDSTIPPLADVIAAEAVGFEVVGFEVIG